MKYSAGLPQDTEPLGSYSGNRMKMLLKGHFSKISRSTDSFRTVPPTDNGDEWYVIACDLETIIVLVLL